MYPFFVAAGVVALGEIGDKTQLLALFLALQFRRPWPIVLGILAATLLNHAAAAAAGAWLAAQFDPLLARRAIGISFLVIALWTLRADHLDKASADARTGWGIFAVTALAFFLAEIGDKTQVATFMLAARFDNLPAVIAGTTAGMLIADVPAVLLAQRIADRVSMPLMQRLAAIAFALLGLWTLFAS
ncbi:MAG: TMEM165/GDT1 family protein [Casimicrobiaceae bacterium]